VWRQATLSKYTILITPAGGAAHLSERSQGDLPAINAPQIEPQWIHLFQQKAAQPNMPVRPTAKQTATASLI
jgi:hypothetical protein